MESCFGMWQQGTSIPDLRDTLCYNDSMNFIEDMRDYQTYSARVDTDIQAIAETNQNRTEGESNFGLYNSE